MKRLAVFCDGTWNNLRMPALTNVARLAKSVTQEAADGIEQVVFYDPGVGVPSRISRVVDFLTGVMGGAFGGGLEDKIENAYRFLVLNYEPGDEIYIFGFSRGAYTARSLCGLIRKCGILRRDCFNMTPQAMDLYRTKAHPTDVASFRAANAYQAGDGHTLATGPEDLADDAKAQWGARHHRRRHPGERALRSEDKGLVYRLVYVGLWDTVGALGIPMAFPFLAKLINPRFGFHDTSATGLITSLRHAVAVNEDRWAFDVTPVSNIHALNVDWATETHHRVDQEGEGPLIPYRDRPYQQRWFPGDHGAIGGGNPERRLYSASLLWIAEGAELAGLELAHHPGGELAEADRLKNPLADWRIDKKGALRPAWSFDSLGLFAGYRDRRGPDTLEEVHESTRVRIRKQATYRPRPLQAFTGKVGPTPLFRIVARVLDAAMILAVLLLLGFGAWKLGALLRWWPGI